MLMKNALLTASRNYCFEMAQDLFRAMGFI
jgi:hypothetical protein